MKSADLPGNEKDRLKALYRYNILDSDAEKDYDEVTALASKICQTEISLISLVDPKRQWFKSTYGIDAQETSRDIAFCAHAILDDKILEVKNALEDERFHDNPLVTGNPNIRFYAGTPLLTKDGFPLGTLCVIDSHPKELNDTQKEALRVLGNQVIHQFDLRYQLIQEQIKNEELKQAIEHKEKFYTIISQDLRAPFSGLVGISEILSEQMESLTITDAKDLANKLLDISKNTLSLLESLLNWAENESNKIKVNLEEFDLNYILQTSIKQLKKNALKKNINIEINDTFKDSIQSDKNMLNSIISNILSNAIKYSHENSNVKIETTHKDNTIEIHFIDNGVGIPEDKMCRLFIPGEKNISTKGTNGEIGSGLGLILTKQLCDKLDYKINIETTPNQETLFIVKIPIKS